MDHPSASRQGRRPYRIFWALVIAMIRRTAGTDYDTNARVFFAAVADGVVK